MRLEYGIAWFEDSKDYVESLEPQFREYLKGLGFDLELTQRADDSDLVEVIKSKDLNLILVDQNLSNQKKGAKLIDAIRDNELYTEVVFYSQYEDFLKEIRKQFEGIFYATRDNLLEKTKKIIDLTIKKNQDISNIRGLFIAETVDATGQMEEIISKILRLGGTQLEFFVDCVVQEEFFTEMAKFKIIQRFLKQKARSLDEKIEKATGTEKADLSQLKTELDEAATQFKSFQTDVIELRNELAHAKKTPGKKNCLTVKNKDRGCYEDKVFNDGKCKGIRESFIKHAQNLGSLGKLLDKL
jgi:cell division protein ZapA (FtsZ GTPase activity inhibitor)